MATDTKVDRHKIIVGYVTFLGTTTGNKALYNPPSLDPININLDQDSEPESKDAKPGSMGQTVKAGSQIVLNFINGLGKTGFFKYTLKKENEKGVTEAFNIANGKAFNGGIIIPKTPGTYRLQVMMGSTVVYDKTLNVVAEERGELV
jgi:hypothetical protein